MLFFGVVVFEVFGFLRVSFLLVKFLFCCVVVVVYDLICWFDDVVFLFWFFGYDISRFF